MKYLKLSLFLIFISLLPLNVASGKNPTQIDIVETFLLPEDHPTKKTLDKIFKASRVILNLDTLKKAGFINPYVRKWTHLVVTSHPQLPGYIIKTYLDAQRYYKEMAEYEHWILRIQGATAIREVLNTYQWNHLFKVPRKWIYALPDEPSPPKEYLRKNFILIEEDMNVLNADSNDATWRSSKVTKETLDALYVILSTLELTDCAKIENIPFSKDGRIAFIDTESFHAGKVPYQRLTSSLPLTLQPYWKELTK